MSDVIDRLRYELGNIGIAIVATREGTDATTLLVQGTNNYRRASYTVPMAILTAAETDELISAALNDIKAQIASNSGVWDEQA